jgi:hypothetical protein
MAEKLTEDPSVVIRELAFTELARQGQALDFSKIRKSLSKEKASPNALSSLGGLLGGTEYEPRPEAVILAFYRNQSADKILADVHWFGIDGVLAYESLATDHYDAIRANLRSDLESGFARVRQQSIGEIESKLGRQYAESVIEQFKDLEAFIQSQFVEAALAGLVANGEPTDIRFGRQYLESGHPAAKLSAVRIIGKFGAAEDVPALLQIAKESWGEMRDEAGIAALRLASSPLDVATRLTDTSDPKLVRAGYAWLYGQSSPEVEKLFEALLNSASDAERLKSIYYFSMWRKREELERMLEAQFNRETYYYNVVTWLDRLLYAPERIKEFFSRDLTRQAT